MKINRLFYHTPEIKEIGVNTQQVLCQSGTTEGFGVNDNYYGNDDWQ